ncbi:MAG: hypothetical protein KDJ36_17115, partial [Hyphomicrobiaceae bacterium]|nr:hypothetical protein [Hyphomicrobiaceae bacterium]
MLVDVDAPQPLRATRERNDRFKLWVVETQIGRVEHFDFDPVWLVPECVTTRAHDVGQSPVLPNQCSLVVGEFDQLHGFTQPAILNQEVEQLVLELRLERADTFNALATRTPQSTPQPVLTGIQESHEVAVTKQQALLIRLDSRYSEHTTPLLSTAGLSYRPLCHRLQIGVNYH